MQDVLCSTFIFYILLNPLAQGLLILQAFTCSGRISARLKYSDILGRNLSQNLVSEVEHKLYSQ